MVEIQNCSSSSFLNHKHKLGIYQYCQLESLYYWLTSASGKNLSSCGVQKKHKNFKGLHSLQCTCQMSDTQHAFELTKVKVKNDRHMQ